MRNETSLDNPFLASIIDSDPVSNFLYTMYKLGFKDWGISNMDELDAIELVISLEEALDRPNYSRRNY